MKRFSAWLLALALVLLATTAWAEEPVRVASLKGPTSMGLVGLMQADEGKGDYNFTVAGTADEIVPLLLKGELDIALVPCNLAAVLYQKTKGAVQMAAVNTLGVLYVVENGDTVHSMADLAGKTLFSTGKGTTPEYVLNTLLAKNGVSANVEYKSEATEVAAAFSAKTADLGLLPQPYVTAVLAQDPDLRVALSLTDEWKKVLPDSEMVTGVVLMRKEFIENRPESVSGFLEAYRDSTAFVNEKPAEAAALIEQLGIAKAAVAEKAIPACNIVCLEGDAMKAAVSGYLQALYDQDPACVGGALPDEGFYYMAQ